MMKLMKGSAIQTSAPPCGSFAAWALPPCARGDRRRRSPARGRCRRALRASSARVKRSNARGRNAGGKPGPSSRTCSSTLPSCARARSASTGAVAVAQRVVDQVAERLLEPRRVGVERARPARGLGAQRPALGARARLRSGAATRAQHVAGVERARGGPAAGPGPSARSPAGPRRAARAGRSPRRPSAARPRAPRACCSPRSASSSSVRRIASGVRSSWMASETNARSRANAASSRREHLVERAPEAADLVVGRRHRQPPARLAGGDRGGAAAHPLDRPQRGGGERRSRRAEAISSASGPPIGEQRVQRVERVARAARATRRRPPRPAAPPRAPGRASSRRSRAPRRARRRSVRRSPRARRGDLGAARAAALAPARGVVAQHARRRASSTCANGSPCLQPSRPVPLRAAARRRRRRGPRSPSSIVRVEVRRDEQR